MFLYRHRFPYFTDALVPVYNRAFEVLAGRANESFRVCSVTDLPYADASFDVVITNIMYHHLDLAEKRRAAAEITWVLKHGGRYVSAEFRPRARSVLQRLMAKGEYALYPSHLIEAGLDITHEELDSFAWGRMVFYRVAVKKAAR
jgi:SAM-dependent methyltransferase